VHAVITRCTRMRIPARSVRRAVNALIEENILRHVDAERVGWHAPRFCAAWQGVSNEVEVRAAIAQARASLAEAAAMPATHQAASSSAGAHATAHA
jgi:hypothetical protein